MRQRRRRALGALGASLALHLGLLAFLWRTPPQPLALPAPQAQVTVEVAILEGAPPPLPVAPATPPPPTPPPSRPRSKPRPKRQPPVRVEAPERAPAPPEPPPPPPPSATEEEAVLDSLFSTPAGREAARRLGLLSVPGPGAHTPGTALPGRTVRPGDTQGADAEADARRAEAFVQGVLADAAAQHRKDSGLVDGYFSEMARALQEGTESPPPFSKGATFVHHLLTAMTPGAEAYARTGTPYAPGAVPEGGAQKPTSTELERLESENPGTGNIAVYEDFVQAGQVMRELADGRYGQGIIALLELRQAPDGSVLSAQLVKSSGNALFDEHVLQTAPAALAGLRPPPTQGQGIHADGLRSVWSFEGRILFKRKVKPGALTLEDGLAMLGQAAIAAAMETAVQGLRGLGASAPGRNGGSPNQEKPSAPGHDDLRTQGLTVPTVTGWFDPATGETEVVDFTNPRFTCRVKLLRVY